ncbi:MAG: peptidylprolyl isomerase [Chloroflexota bacterium]
MTIATGCGGDSTDTPTPIANLPTIALPAEDQANSSNTAESEVTEVQPTPTETPIPATATPVPTPTPILVALVNEQPILLSEYEIELERYRSGQEALGIEVEPNYEERVFMALVEKAIITTTALENNISITGDMVEARLAELVDIAGGQENYDAWLVANQISAEEFPSVIAFEMLTDEVELLVTADVPYATDQVRASYIALADQALADALLGQIQNGADFAALAQAYSLDQTTASNGGDLDFFSSLLVPELETAAFSLEIGEVSDVITVQHSNGQISHYIIKVTERENDRPLTDEQRSTLLKERFENWLVEQLTTAEVIRFETQ